MTTRSMLPFHAPALFVAFAAGLALASPALAGGTLTFTEDPVANTTTIRFQGSIDTSALTGTEFSELSFFTLFSSATGDVSFGPGIAAGINYRLPANTFPTFGTSPGPLVSGTFLGGDRLTFGTNGSINDFVRVPNTYVSGSPLDSAALYSGTFASLNITPGNYTATIPGNAPIVYVFNTIPTPSAAALLAMGGVFAARRRRTA
jgi:hypothetical protein